MKTILRCGVALVVFLTSCQPASDNTSDTDKLFTLLTPEFTGVDFRNPIEETEKENHLVNDMLISGAGVAIGDINNDGLSDLFFTGNQVQDRLYLNKGNLRFEDITDKAGILPEKIWSSGATFGDVNNDGYLDLYVSKYAYGESQLGENLLYINNGDLTFSEQAAEWGLADRGFSVQATFFDFDMDGNLDLYLLNQPPSKGNRKGNKVTLSRLRSIYYTDKIYRNTGEGRFFDATDWAGVNNLAMGLSATVGDLNNDLLPDIYVANDYEKPDHLYINQGMGKYKNMANQSLKHMSNFSMGTDIADYDNDGLLDIVAVDMVAEDHKRIKTNMGGMDPQAFWDVVNKGWHYQYMFNTLQRNNGNTTFSEVAHLAGVSNTDWSWSALFGDFDNDGWKDLFITNGVKRAMRNSDLGLRYGEMLDSLELVAESQDKGIWELVDIMELVEMAPVERIPNYVFHNNGDLTFTKKSEDWGVDLPTLSYGAAYADLDNDGDLELIVNNTDDFAHIYRNNTMEKGIGNYLRVVVKDKTGAPAYGAKVKLYQGDQFWQLQELSNSRGYKSKSEDALHFGLGDIDEVDKVEITWSYGEYLVLEDVEANQIIEVDPNMTDQQVGSKQPNTTLFRNITNVSGIRYRHYENEYDDFEKEVLLPHKMSNFGPGLAVGDVNGDGLEDFFVGGAAGYAGQIQLQQSNKTFEAVQIAAFEKDKHHEDLGAEFFDADNDGDLDLYVVSGGNEFIENSPELQDRLYRNLGNGKFVRSGALPKVVGSGSRVISNDYDSDGDLDLFVGGRLLPGTYPRPGRSYLLRNDNGKFTDVTDELAPELSNLGMVTDAKWTDYNSDGMMDLVVVGEWMPVTLFENQGGKLIEATNNSGLENSQGWYYSLVVADIDQDGDEDFIAGNLGLNYKYKASSAAPFEVYSHDFDGNGSLDIVLSYHEHGELVPLRGKSCSTDQIPGLSQQFPTYEAFGEANLRDVYGQQLDQAYNLQAKTFATSYIENLGDGSFKIHQLPNHAQFSSVNSVLVDDYNEDGHLDLLIAGNLYGSEIETPRNDAGMGLYLTGDGQGNFTPIPLLESGFFAPHNVKDMKQVRLGGDNGARLVLVANNQGWMQAILNQSASSSDDQLISLK